MKSELYGWISLRGMKGRRGTQMIPTFLLTAVGEAVSVHKKERTDVKIKNWRRKYKN
jgi:hypothetical protein